MLFRLVILVTIPGMDTSQFRMLLRCSPSIKVRARSLPKRFPTSRGACESLASVRLTATGSCSGKSSSPCCRLAMRSSRTRFVTQTTWQKELAMCFAPLRGSAQLRRYPANVLQSQPHEHASKAVDHGWRVRCLSESSLVEEGSRSDIRHRHVNLVALVIDRIPLDDSGTLRPSKLYRPSEERMRDAIATMSWSYANAPHRPHIGVVEMGDLSISCESRVRAPGDGSPAHRLVAVVCEDANRARTEEFGDLPGALRPFQSRILLGRNPIAQAPADVCISAFRAQYSLDIREDGCRSNR